MEHICEITIKKFFNQVILFGLLWSLFFKEKRGSKNYINLTVIVIITIIDFLHIGCMVIDICNKQKSIGLFRNIGFYNKICNTLLTKMQFLSISIFGLPFFKDPSSGTAYLLAIYLLSYSRFIPQF